ncbi:zinc finger protein 572-like, partial [Ixodes scapularis]|uniref:zinc finger protein 572-like n=1 Tax=Ixodes scapularis TaxID=6945 RepID=UPI001A9F0435
RQCRFAKLVVRFACWHWTFFVVNFPCLVFLISPTVLAEAVFRDDGDNESDSFSPRSELIESQPTMRPRYEGTYHCKFCSYSSHHLGHINQHERTHTGEKPFRCSVCKIAFAQIGNLRTHMRIHTGEKPYQCRTCGKEFSQRDNWSRHERTHSGERPYKCEACEKTFKRSQHLSRHQKNVHE